MLATVEPEEQSIPLPPTKMAPPSKTTPGEGEAPPHAEPEPTETGTGIPAKYKDGADPDAEAKDTTVNVSAAEVPSPTEPVREAGGESVSPAEDPAQEGVDAVPTMLDAGRKHFTLQNWEGAVQLFGKAAEILSSVYGPFALECAEAMVWYGKALIRNAVAQAGLVDTKNAEKKQIGTADAEVGPSSHFVFEDDAEEASEGEEEAGEEAADQGTSAQPDGEQEIDTDETDDDFTLAWEALSVAAKIYEGQTSEDCKRRLADVYMLMGDCCLEDDNSTQAIETFKKALDLKVSYLEPSDRELAEVHHLLGLAYEHDNMIAEAVAHVEKARGVLEKRIVVLKEGGKVDGGDKGKGKVDPAQAKAEEEIVELESLIVEIDAKMDDLQNLAAQQAEGDAEAKKETMASLPQPGAPVNDLSTLIVKKKRRAEDVNPGPVETESEAKRPKTTDAE
ncbi:hypothetical protein DFJ74DRAFT_667231 [Hyaloraphidium curvatum]|nr:hypothetical protein DFJ74DRAFT_667231 [Hyaloraphidium curvatum]